MNCKATVVRDNDGYIITEAITHVVSFGKTKREAIENLQAAMEQYYSGYKHGEIQIGVIE